MHHLYSSDDLFYKTRPYGGATQSESAGVGAQRVAGLASARCRKHHSYQQGAARWGQHAFPNHRTAGLESPLSGS